MNPSIGTETRWPADIDIVTSQKAILPASDMVAALEKRYRLALSWHFEPIGGAGGDIWGIQALDDDTLALYAADFAGHGPPAAANTFLLHGLLSELHADGLGVDPAAILGAINEELVGTLATGNFTAMIYGVLSVRSATFAYAAAMMPRPIVAERGGARIHVGDGAGFPLGVSRDAVHENRHVPFPPDSFLLMHSDAMTEGRRKEGSRWSKEGIAEMVRHAAEGSIEAMDVGTLIAPFLRDVERPLVDDLTVVCCHRLAR
jgi:phosphoserine phosphatase RsbU/P